MNDISPWASSILRIFQDEKHDPLFERHSENLKIDVYCTNTTLWLLITDAGECQTFIRMAYDPSGNLCIKSVANNDNGVIFTLEASFGQYVVNLGFPENDLELFRYTTSLVAEHPLFIPFWPRDLLLRGNKPSEFARGKVHLSQAGTRTGLIYLSYDSPGSGALLYLQNLTALNDYCQATETSSGDVVGGTWPELGFALPPAVSKPLPAGQKIVLSDAFFAMSPENPKDDFQRARQFLELLAKVYVHLPRPDTKYHDWPGILDKGLNDLQHNHGCWMHTGGLDYLNAYACDYATPPELMVQLAVLLPLQDYYHWSKADLPAMRKIQSGIASFYDDKIGSVVRWLPSMAEELDGSEEQLKPNVMDSWYLHHPLLNLSRLAMSGDKTAEGLFLDSLPFAIKVAHHFKYNWPVFYNMETLEVIKAETQPGKGGEKDVAGLYALVLLHAWRLTGENKYLEEAKRSAKTLKGKGFDLFYQANNTAFSANATLWLHQETGEQIYLELCYMCLANIFKNVQLWECNYGYAKDYSTFFGVFPLNDAPYTAAYEEQEVFAALHNFLLYAKDTELLPALKILIPEFIRFVVYRAAFYYPPNLPEEMLSSDIKMGELDRNLWIAVEDLHDGWEQSGQVGQEVYGAGVAFGIVPRHFYKVPGGEFMVFVDYPTSDFVHHKHNELTFSVNGVENLTCRLMIIGDGEKLLDGFKVYYIRKSKKVEVTGDRLKNGDLEYTISGNQRIGISWNGKKLKAE